MKRYLKSSIAALLVVVIFVATYVPVIAVGQPSSYSSSSNSGQRDVVCTTLNGTNASNYYKGNNTYDTLSNKTSTEIFNSLRSLMRSTHSYNSSYDDCHYKANLTDCENNNTSKLSLIYTSYDATQGQWNGWNREHIWPKSLGGDTTSGGGADLHHIRPSDALVNSTRGNKLYGYANGGKAVTGNTPATGVLGGYSGTYFEPLDNVKGDVARICLYVYVRWGSDWGANNITEVFQSIDVLLEWCEMDPVDTWEMGRNEVVEDIQGNRNVFIDYPEYAWLIFGREVPSDMQTPSGKASANGGSQGGTTTPDPDTPVTPDPDDSFGVVDPVPGTAYKFGMVQENLSKTDVYYLAGGMAQTYYLATTTDESAALDVYIESTSGGYYLYSVDISGKKQYINTVVSGTHVNGVYESSPSTVYTYDKTSRTLIADVNGTDYWFGTRNDMTYTTVGPCAVSYDGFYCQFYGNSTTDTPVDPHQHVYVNGKCECGATDPNYEAPHTHNYVNGKCECGAVDPNYVPPCTHNNTEIKNAAEALCHKDGYTGDTYCKDCGVKLSSGESIPAIGHHNFGDWVANSKGEYARHCLTCGYEEYLTVDILLSSIDNEAEKILLLLILGGSDSTLHFGCLFCFIITEKADREVSPCCHASL